MATSGTTSFNPALGQLAGYALGHVGVRRTAILQEHLADAYMAANLVQQDWSNDQPLLWDVDLQSVALTQGQQTVTCPADTIMVADAYIQTSPGAGTVNNKIIFAVGRSEWASYPNPLQQAPPTTFWFDRLITPTINLYPVPDQNGPYQLFYYRFKQNEDAVIGNQTQVAVPPRWLMAYADAIALELSFTYAPDKSAGLALKLNGNGSTIEGSYTRARRAEREVVPIYIQPGLSFYYDNG